MNGQDAINYIKIKKPQYSVSRKPLLERFANKGFSKGDYSQFGPIYQIYMYAFVLGFHQNERLPLPVSAKERTEFLEIGKWQPEGIVDYILMLLLSNDQILKEAEIDFIQMDDMEEDDVKSRFTHVVKIMEEYANAGFSLLEERFVSNPYFFNDSFSFVVLLREIANGKLNSPNIIP